MPIVGLNVSNNFDRVLQSIAVFECSVFRGPAQGGSSLLNSEY